MHPEKELTTLGLHLPTDPRWANLAAMSLEEILADHAFCEQKAASAGISLIQLFPDKKELVQQVSEVVAEEWEHFKMVVKELENRNLKLGFQRKDIYVTELLKFVKKGGSREDRLLDLLLLSAVIEARSCERFKLLAHELQEQNLKDFYQQFVISEAGHYRLFINLAELYLGKEKTWKRWQEFLDYEAQVMADIGLRAGSMH